MLLYWGDVMVKEYTERYKGFQIRDVCYVEEPPKDEPLKYDVVQWYRRDFSEEFCWSVANLVYDPKEPCFDLESIGLRWLECHPDEDVENWIIKWCEYKLQELDTD